MSSQPERDYITQGTGRAVARFPPPAQSQRSRLHAWGRREPRAPPLPPQLRPRVPGPHPQRPPPAPAPPTPPRRSRPARLRTSAVRGRGARTRAAPPGGRGRQGIPGPRPPSAGARGSMASTRARARAHTPPRRTPRPPLPWAAPPLGGRGGAPGPSPTPARAPSPPSHCLVSERLAQRKDNGTPGRRGWGAPGLARSLTSRGRRRR